MKTKQIFLSSVFAASCVLFANAQGPQLASVAKPSPNVQAMQKYGDIPVSPYTGIPNISVPLYTVKFRDITVPISLSYHASGIKVGEEASQVGLGWVLNAGGMISRTVIGGDDFQDPSYFNGTANTQIDFSDGRFPMGFLQYNGVLKMASKKPGDQTFFNDTVWTALENNVEFQPDQYYFSVPGGSGKFIMKRDRHAVLQNQEKIQISVMSADGKYWQVKTLDGTTYDFNNVFETYTDDLGYVTQHMSAWYLTKITSPTGNIVTFNYTTYTKQTHSIGSYSELVNLADVPAVSMIHDIAPQRGPAPGKIYTQVTLSSIDFPTGQVQFKYSSDSSRLDLAGEKELDSICVFSKGVNGNLSAAPFKTEVLGYSYFDYGNIDDDYNVYSTYGAYVYKRLKLTKVQEFGYYNGVRTPANPYLLNYYEGTAMTDHLPSKSSFARDHWGYYNGKTSNTSLIPTVTPVTSNDLGTFMVGIDGIQRNVDTSYLRAFSLQSIQYPTGGSTELQYEANDFDEQQSEVNDNSYFNKAYTITQNQIQKDFDVNRSVDTLHLEDEYKLDTGLTKGISNIQLNATFRFASPYDCGKVFTYGATTFGIYDSTGTTLLVSQDLANMSNCTGGATSNCLMCNSGVYTFLTNVLLPPAKYVLKVHATFDTSLMLVK